MSVGGPGLPAELEGENYWCYFKDSKERFNFSVPAEPVEGSEGNFSLPVEPAEESEENFSLLAEPVEENEGNFSLPAELAEESEGNTSYICNITKVDLVYETGM